MKLLIPAHSSKLLKTVSGFTKCLLGHYDQDRCQTRVQNKKPAREKERQNVSVLTPENFFRRRKIYKIVCYGQRVNKIAWSRPQ